MMSEIKTKLLEDQKKQEAIDEAKLELLSLSKPHS